MSPLDILVIKMLICLIFFIVGVVFLMIGIMSEKISDKTRLIYLIAAIILVIGMGLSLMRYEAAYVMIQTFG